MTLQELAEQLSHVAAPATQQQEISARISALDTAGRDELARALKKQADQLLYANIQRAQETADLILYLAECTGDPAHRALGLLAQANALNIGLGEYKRAVEIYDAAASVYYELDRPVDQARAQSAKLWALANLGRYDEALETGRWACGVLEAHAQWETLAVMTMNIANVYSRVGDDVRMLEMLDRSDALHRQLGTVGQLYWLLVQQNRGIALRNLGRFKESLQASRTAWKGLEDLGQQVEAARALMNLAFTHFILGRYNEALEYFDQTRDVFLADGRQRDAMLVELFTSDCLLQLRRFSDVLDKCRRVRQLFAELGTRRVVAQAIVNEGVAFAELGRHAEALTSLAEARQIFSDEGIHAQVASTDLEIATVLQRQGRHEESLMTAQACAAIFSATNLPVEEAQAQLTAAQAAIALAQYDQARHLTSAALRAGDKHDIPTLKYRGHHLLGALAAAQQDREQALAAYDHAIQEVERLRGRLMIEYRVGFVEDKEEIYQEVVDLCLDLDQPLRGLEYAERAKSRALLDLLAQRLDLSIQAREAADQPLVEEMMRLRAERDRLYRRLESDVESGERGWVSSDGERGRAQQQVLALEKQITELWHRLLVRNAGYAREAALWNVRTEPIQPYLDPDTLLVEYFGVRGKLVAFLVTAETVRAQRLEGDLTQIQRLMQLLWLNLKAVPKSEPSRVSTLASNAQGLLERLYKLVLAPLSDALQGHRQLIIVPHGPLHYLPFHALHDGTAYLLERHEISYLPGASCLRYCQEAPRAETGLFAVGHSHDDQLPHAVQEARTVASLLAGQARLEDQATLAELQQAVLACRAVHLAAHGDFRPDNPLFSGIALSDGWLTTLDIFNLRLQASLVTLSACQTGRNVVGGGDELLGLMRAFLGAGAASLVLSLWAVEDRSTAQLMELFYRKLAQGWSKREALRDAQLQLLNQQNGSGRGDYSHPYFWAPFFLVGDPGPL